MPDLYSEDTKSSGLPNFEQRSRRLGFRKNDASPGDHTHNGANSKKLKSAEIFSDQFRVVGAWNVAGGAGDITVPHTLGVVPTGVVFAQKGVTNRGFSVWVLSSSDASNLVIRCFDTANVAYPNGTSMNFSIIAWV